MRCSCFYEKAFQSDCARTRCGTSAPFNEPDRTEPFDGTSSAFCALCLAYTITSRRYIGAFSSAFSLASCFAFSLRSPALLARSSSCFLEGAAHFGRASPIARHRGPHILVRDVNNLYYVLDRFSIVAFVRRGGPSARSTGPRGAFQSHPIRVRHRRGAPEQHNQIATRFFSPDVRKSLTDTVDAHVVPLDAAAAAAAKRPNLLKKSHDGWHRNGALLDQNSPPHHRRVRNPLARSFPTQKNPRREAERTSVIT